VARKQRKGFLQKVKAAIKIQKVWRGYFVYKKFHYVLASCKYVDDEDFDYSGVDESLFTLPDQELDWKLQINFPSSFSVHNYNATNVEDTPRDLPHVVDENMKPTNDEFKHLVKVNLQSVATVSHQPPQEQLEDWNFKNTKTRDLFMKREKRLAHLETKHQNRLGMYICHQ
jgi:hypothetical protein